MRVEIEIVTTGPRRGERILVPYRGEQLATAPMLWLSASREEHPPNTRQSVLTTIGLVDTWAELFDIDYEHMLMWGEAFDEDLLTSLSYYLGFYARDLSKLLQINRSRTRSLDLNKILVSFEPVDNQTISTRLWGVREYFAFLVTYGNAVMARHYQVPNGLIERRRRLTAKPKNEKGPPPVGSLQSLLKGPRMGNRRKGTPTDVDNINRFCDWVLTELKPDQLWGRNHRRALRNMLVILLALNAGMRKGEIQQLKIRDINYRKKQIRVVRRHGDPDDSRKREPAAKTHARTLPLGPSVYELLKEWLDVRNDIMDEVEDLGRDDNDFIFVNIDRNPENYGKEISSAAVQQIMDDVTKASGISIRFHDLRHASIMELAETMARNNLNDIETVRHLENFGGWALGSPMPGHYAASTDSAIAKEEHTRMLERRGYKFEKRDSFDED